MRVVLLGPPGSGKTTQARELAREWGLPHIATGDILREAVTAGTALGREAKRYMESGALVPDEVLIGLIADRLAQADLDGGFVLEGFPRTIGQADALDRLLERSGRSLDHVFNLEVGEPELRRRLSAGRGRADDSERVVRKRLDVYARETAPVLDHYRARGRLETVSGVESIDAVRSAIRKRLSTWSSRAASDRID